MYKNKIKMSCIVINVSLNSCVKNMINVNKLIIN